MSEEKKQYLTIDGKDIDVDSLTDEQKYFCRQIEDLKLQKNQINFKLQQLEVALGGFESALIGSFKKDEEPVIKS
tara:strand:- start:156 stop:380 length:225 start_codon:yes stop_codon:yes gene_type:complete